MDTQHCLFGFAEADITPDQPVRLVGFPRADNRPKGVLHRLCAQVLLFSHHGKKYCITAIDSIGFTVSLTSRLRALMAQNLGVAPSAVMVCFSHTPAAPDAEAEPGSFRFACGQVLAALSEAKARLSPFYAAWGAASAELGVNRRGEGGVVDRRLGILKITDPEGRLRLVLLRLSAHANVLTSDNYLISSDYFGSVRDLLKKEFGCGVMLLQGASGNLRPKYQQENAQYLEVHAFEASQRQMSRSEKERNIMQSRQALIKMAETVCRAVASVLGKLKPMPVRRLELFSERYMFFADLPKLERALEIAAQAQAEAGIDAAPWLAEIKRLHGANITAQEADLEVSYFLLNQGCICGVANEAMCELALEVQGRFPGHIVLFNGYTNGIDSYLPTADEYDKGGYEVLWSNLIYFTSYGRVMPLNRDTAELLTNLVSARIARLFS